MKYLIATMLLLFMAMGCGPTIVKHPDTPMLIIEARGRVRVAVEKSEGEIIEFGWIDLGPLDGWTISKYDWSREVGGGD